METKIKQDNFLTIYLNNIMLWQYFLLIPIGICIFNFLLGLIHLEFISSYSNVDRMNSYSL